MKSVPISMHCWQGDDVGGFEGAGELSGGIQTTGNYPGKAGTPEELMADIDKALSLIPGKHRINLHASYAIFEDGEKAGRDKLEPKHFAKWVEFLDLILIQPTSHILMRRTLHCQAPMRKSGGSGLSMENDLSA